jgi:hypothetical protein
LKSKKTLDGFIEVMEIIRKNYKGVAPKLKKFIQNKSQEELTSDKELIDFLLGLGINYKNE